MPFAYAINARVTIKASGESGTVVARSEHRNGEDQYLIEYSNRQRVAVQQWWGVSSLFADPTATKNLPTTEREPMSYSFNQKSPNKEAAKADVAANFANVVASQPTHQKDSAAVLANANAVIDLLADDDSKDIAVTCSGYVSWNADQSLHTVSIACSAAYTARP